jgi:hypothetical protein
MDRSDVDQNKLSEIVSSSAHKDNTDAERDYPIEAERAIAGLN